jgi:predicted transposase/invertase (TIGR01784 family)
MPRYLDPKIDLAFKRVFGEHADLLISFLNALLPLPDDAPIESLEYLTPEQVPELPGLFKNSIVDVKCRDALGRTFIVEMQMLWSSSFEQRIVFSAGQAYVKQLRPGQSYSSLKPVYALALTTQIFDRETPDYYHHYQLVNVRQPQQVLKGLEFVFIELPKFKPGISIDPMTYKRMHVKWLRFLNEVGEQALAPDLQADADLQSALQLLETGGFSEMELEAYHVHMDKLRIEPTVIEDAKAEGKAVGKAEAEAQIIKALHASGMNAVQISAITQLSLDAVRQHLAI